MRQLQKGKKSPVPFQLAEGQPRHVTILVELMKQFYKEDHYPFSPSKARKAFRELLNSRLLGRVWLIRIGQTNIGYIVLTLGYAMEFYGRDAFIDDFYISKSYRRQGIGRSALSKVIRHARSLKIMALHLEVNKSKPAAEHLYRSLGFRTRNQNHLLTKIIS